jgi:hypothetical protein
MSYGTLEHSSRLCYEWCYFSTAPTCLPLLANGDRSTLHEHIVPVESIHVCCGTLDPSTGQPTVRP